MYCLKGRYSHQAFIYSLSYSTFGFVPFYLLYNTNKQTNTRARKKKRERKTNLSIKFISVEFHTKLENAIPEQNFTTHSNENTIKF